MNTHNMYNLWNDARYIVGKHRGWYHDLTYRFELHPAVVECLKKDYRPHNWHLMLLEWPHRAETDANRLAYTRDERAGLDNRQTVTSIGKYLMRHYNGILSDNYIRDLVARYTSGDDTFEFLHTTDEMIHAVNNGPSSCMCWHEGKGTGCADGVRRHPYAVYTPEYGWHMAVRKTSAGEIVGRALCMSDPDSGDQYWVRSYKRCEGYSHTDEFLESWLTAAGYRKKSAYDSDTKLSLIWVSRDSEVLMPYIDGGRQSAEIDYSSGVLRLRSDGVISGSETCGYASIDENSETCEDCGDRVHADDICCVGENEDRYVCQCCRDDHYNYAISRRGEHYYIPNDDVVYVESTSEAYHVDYMERNGIVELANGDYEHTDNAVYVEREDEWYSDQDTDIVYCEHSGEYELIDNCEQLHDGDWAHKHDCWQCEGSGDWYLNDVEPVTIDGELYHPDNAPQTEESKGE